MSVFGFGTHPHMGSRNVISEITLFCAFLCFFFFFWPRHFILFLNELQKTQLDSHQIMDEKNDFPACLATLLLHRLMVGSLSEYPSQSARRLVRTPRQFQRTAGSAEASRGFCERWEMRTDSKLEGHLLVGLDRRCRLKNKTKQIQQKMNVFPQRVSVVYYWCCIFFYDIFRA